MRIAIISGGDIQETFASGFLSEYKPDKLIAADRGLEFCLQNGFLPDLLVGDFDSLQNEELFHLIDSVPFSSGKEDDEKEQIRIICGKKTRIIRHRPEKDATDTELAVAQAVGYGAGEVCLLGATGTRLDHVWGNLSLLCRLRNRLIRGWIIDANNRISMPLNNRYVLRREEQFGKYVSILPYGGSVTGLTLRGFHYPLSDYTLEPGWESLCVSNQIDGETAEILWNSGIPAVIESRD